LGKEQILPPPWALPCEEKTMRVGGYYWVKRDCDSDWEMGEWDTRYSWFILNGVCHLQQPEYIINEERILNPDEVT